MNRRPWRKAAAGLVAALAIVVVLIPVAGASAAKKSPFEPGLYVGKTSQGEPVKLQITVGQEPCDGNPCLFVPSDEDEVYISIPCPTIEGSTNDYLAPFGNAISRKGIVDADQEGFSKLKATLKVSHHGTLTGRLRDTETLEDGAKCDSGPVTLRAKLAGKASKK